MNGLMHTSWLSPWRRLREVEREMNRLFSDFSASRPGSFPPVNLYTDAEGAVVTAELPGVAPDDLDVTVNDRLLTIRGERKPEQTSDDDTWHRRERVFGTFTRDIELPFGVDSEKVDAKYRDGVLKVRLERSDAEKPKKIAVK